MRFFPAKHVLLCTLVLVGLALTSAGSRHAWAEDAQQTIEATAYADSPGATPTPSIRPVLTLPPNQPERGLIYDGLEPAAEGPCSGGYRVRQTNRCTHGPDPAPRGVDITKRVPARQTPRNLAASNLVCEGNGTTGKRVQVVYAHAADVADQYGAYLPSFRQWAAEIDSIISRSAAATGGSRRVRFVTDAQCNLVVLHVRLSPAGDDTYDTMVGELQRQGLNRHDRKYLVFMDANVYCGLGDLFPDDHPDTDNYNNSGPSYSRIDAGCWWPGVAAHELMHNLGGVQLSAPHSSGGWHCIDTYDVMCYSDYPNFPAMQYLCPDVERGVLFDCNHDDYFSTSPPAGSYLATHWNTANNHFLWRPDSIPPTGAITAPANGSVTSDPFFMLAVDVRDNAGGSGVYQVEFKARYNGSWHSICTEIDPPYMCIWEAGPMIDQPITFAIDVTDNAGHRSISAGGNRTMRLERGIRPVVFLPLVRRR
jgi:hypothetical protein